MNPWLQPLGFTEKKRFDLKKGGKHLFCSRNDNYFLLGTFIEGLMGRDAAPLAAHSAASALCRRLAAAGVLKLVGEDNLHPNRAQTGQRGSF